MNPSLAEAVLFDLDGTLVDTAMDFTLATNLLLSEMQRPTITLSQVRQQVSQGALAIIEMAFPDIRQQDTLLRLRNRMVNHYHQHIATHSALYHGLSDLLTYLHRKHIPWGIVTNKPEALAKQLISALNLDPLTPHCIVGGDTLAHAKPHPAPMQHAAQLCGTSPERCLYIGDHERDILAARAANMMPVAVSYGYLSVAENPQHWGADYVFDSPYQLTQWIQQQL